MNVGLGGDDLELETNKKGETSVGPRQTVVQVSIFLPEIDSRHFYCHNAFNISVNIAFNIAFNIAINIAFNIAFNAQTVCADNIQDHTWTP